MRGMTGCTALGLLLLTSLGAGCGGDDSQGCFSPKSNFSTDNQPRAMGCPCDPTVDKDVCVEGKAVGCVYGRWSVGIDGPCMPGIDAGGLDQVSDVSRDLGDIDVSRDLPAVDLGHIDVSRDVPAVDLGDIDVSRDLPPVDLGDIDSNSDGAGVLIDVPPLDTGISCSLDAGCPSGSTCKAGQCEACFTATLHPELVSIPSDRGCPCESPSSEGACVKGTGVVCYSGRWMAVLDGPCMPGPDAGR